MAMADTWTIDAGDKAEAINSNLNLLGWYLFANKVVDDTDNLAKKELAYKPTGTSVVIQAGSRSPFDNSIGQFDQGAPPAGSLVVQVIGQGETSDMALQNAYVTPQIREELQQVRATLATKTDTGISISLITSATINQATLKAQQAAIEKRKSDELAATKAATEAAAAAKAAEAKAAATNAAEDAKTALNAAEQKRKTDEERVQAQKDREEAEATRNAYAEAYKKARDCVGKCTAEYKEFEDKIIKGQLMSNTALCAPTAFSASNTGSGCSGGTPCPTCRFSLAHTQKGFALEASMKKLQFTTKTGSAVFKALQSSVLVSGKKISLPVPTVLGNKVLN